MEEQAKAQEQEPMVKLVQQKDSVFKGEYAVIINGQPFGKVRHHKFYATVRTARNRHLYLHDYWRADGEPSIGYEMNRKLGLLDTGRCATRKKAVEELVEAWKKYQQEVK